MNCQECDYEFNIFKFAYRSIRKCPKCGKMYDMIFPTGLTMVSIVLSLIICMLITLSASYNLAVNISIFILVYYLVDVLFKIICIYTNNYKIIEFNSLK